MTPLQKMTVMAIVNAVMAEKFGDVVFLILLRVKIRANALRHLWTLVHVRKTIFAIAMPLNILSVQNLTGCDLSY